MIFRALILPLLVVAAPAAAQTSGCVRDASGALQCAPKVTNGNERGVSPIPKLPRRDLAADAVGRAREQAQAMKNAMDRQQQEADDVAADRRALACRSAPAAEREKAAAAAMPCSR